MKAYSMDESEAKKTFKPAITTTEKMEIINL